MDYRKKMACKEKECNGQLIVPLKLTIQDSDLIIDARCPKCHERRNFSLPMSDKRKWLPILTDMTLRCDECGARVKKNWYTVPTDPDIAGMIPWMGRRRFGTSIWRTYHYYSYFHPLLQPNRKIIAKCKKCGKERSKIISEELLRDLKVHAKLPSLTYQCPYCDAEIAEDATTCPTCKKDIACDKCSKPLPPHAKFCSFCGHKIEKVSTKGEGISGKNICPACNELFKKDSRFCAVCGQELICAHCNAHILIGASFCVECGDPVIKGKSND